MKTHAFATALCTILLSGCAKSSFPPAALKDQISIVPSDDFPRLFGGVQIQVMTTQDRGGLLLGQVHLRNPGGSRMVWIKGNWFTAQGLQIEDPKETWREIPMAADEERTVHFSAPDPAARHLRIQLRRGTSRPR